MTQKERLVELLKQTDKEYERQFWLPHTREYSVTDEAFDFFADYLLQNGGIVPPCKVGDTVYDIGGFPKIMEAEVETMTTDGQEMSSVVVSKGKPFHRWFVNWKDAGIFVFLTREDAKRALKERKTK